ncbi:MAG: glycosyltransferase family 2 protein [Lachnospiraceae bacterium]|nr:glycosyltransferase family 2 protein [Lachnospiraceae bacterium]
MANILVLATCHNRKEKTLNFVNTLRQDGKQTFSFIIVDDNSSDGTAEALALIPDICLIKGNGNLYYSGGMRVAIEAAHRVKPGKYDFIMLANDDVEFYEEAITKLIDYLGTEESIAVGATCNSAGEMSYSGAIKTSKLKPSYRNVMSTQSKKRYCDTFCANCVLIPADIFYRLGNIDPVFQHAMGDFDYGCEARKKGFKIMASWFFVGICNDNSRTGTWKDITLTRKDRMKLKESPKGLPKKEWFHYLYKNHGFVTAIIYSIVPYVQIMLGK